MSPRPDALACATSIVAAPPRVKVSDGTVGNRLAASLPHWAGRARNVCRIFAVRQPEPAL